MEEFSELDSETAARWHRSQAVAANNAVWDLLNGTFENPDRVDQLLCAAYASAYHWRSAAGRSEANFVRSSWLLSRCHAVTGGGELARHHADQCLELATSAGMDDFDLAYAHEAKARALAAVGNLPDAEVEYRLAVEVAIADPENLAVFESDLHSEPWFGLRTS